MHTTATTIVVALFGLASFPAIPQKVSSMPNYKPQQQVSGTIRIRGDYHQRVMLMNWEAGFREFQHNIAFEDELTSTAHGIPALVFGLADLALLGREIAPLEDLAFRRMFKYDPTEIVTATGS